MKIIAAIVLVALIGCFRNTDPPIAKHAKQKAAWELRLSDQSHYCFEHHWQSDDPYMDGFCRGMATAAADQFVVEHPEILE